MSKSDLKTVVAALVFFAVAGAAVRAQLPAPVIPPDVAAVLREHLGRWRTEGTLMTNGVTLPAKATWECEVAVGGAGVICTWTHEWPGGVTDRAVDIFGYDPILNVLSGSRVTDRGIVSQSTLRVQGNTMIGRWESVDNGKPLVGVNEIVIVPGGDWTQRMSIDVGGERVTEMNVTHHRLQ